MSQEYRLTAVKHYHSHYPRARRLACALVTITNGEPMIADSYYNSALNQYSCHPKEIACTNLANT
jgi:hypothetical protein